MSSSFELELTLDVEIKYSIHGKYYAQTMTDPEEFPEVEIESVKFGSIDITSELSENEMNEITIQCWKDAVDRANSED